MFRKKLSNSSLSVSAIGIGSQFWGAKQDINEAFKSAAANELHGILEYTEDPIVSSDIVKNPHSCIIDGLSTMVMEGNMVKVLGWYDNEWGYSCRTSDLCAFLADKGL